MYELALDITQDNIDNGKRGNPCSCPIARRLADYFHTKNGQVHVYPDFARIWEKDLRLRCALDANDFIVKFDAQESVSPTTLHFYFEATS